MENSTGESSKSVHQIKIFQTIKKNLSTIGIGPNSAKQLRPFNAKIFVNLSAVGIGFIGTLMYIIIEARTFLEFAQSIYMCSTFVLVACILMTLIFNLSELFETIDNCESLVNTSKWRKIHSLTY